MSMDGQAIKWLRNIARNFNRLSRVHERYRGQTDGRQHSESEREFTFAKKFVRIAQEICQHGTIILPKVSKLTDFMNLRTNALVLMKIN